MLLINMKLLTKNRQLERRYKIAKKNNHHVLHLEIEKSLPQLLAWLLVQVLSHLIGQLRQRVTEATDYITLDLPCERTGTELAPGLSPAS